MITTPTLFILGAGSSKPYGYPTGAELRADIINNFVNYFLKLKDVDKKDLSNVPRIRRGIEKFVNIFSKSSLTSIDKFLSLNPAVAAYGKIGITLSILNSENNSNFREEVNPQEDWYTYLFNRMMEGLKKPEDYKDFSKNNVAFITFNYDRSLEYFLHESFYHSFYQERRDIEKLINFKIIHVYGVVDEFKTSDWPEHNYKHNYYDNYLFIEGLSKNIRVIGEERVGESIKDEIKKLLPDYKRIFFLGFSFAQDNLDAIDLPKNINETWKIFGAAKGMTQRERNEARTRINSYFRDKSVADILKNPLIKDEDSCALLREHL